MPASLSFEVAESMLFAGLVGSAMTIFIATFAPYVSIATGLITLVIIIIPLAFMAAGRLR